MIQDAILQKAIAAHSSWKARLRMAVSSSKLNASIETIKADNQCEFGRFLNGPALSAADKSTTHFQSVKNLHTAFHVEAGHVATWCTTGQKEKAQQSLGLGGNFAKSSAALFEALLKWSTDIK